MKLAISTDTWEMREPFVTATETTTHVNTVTVTLTAGRFSGRGEALGVDYLGEDAGSMTAQIETVRGDIERGVDRETLQALLPSGGARNALDCALWDLEAKREGRRAWDLLGLEAAPVVSVYTLGLDTPGNMAREARAHSNFPVLKLKLGQEGTADKLRAIRAARPTAELVIDANGSWTPPLLDDLADVLVECRVGMLEQPLPAGDDDALEGLEYPVTLCADESCQDGADLEHLPERYGMVNIKLDKCGGLTEAMRMVQWCRDREIALMVGNMLGSSLAMAPAFIVAQRCRYVDLDGPLWQKTDRATPIVCENAVMQPPGRELWG